jgi:hypothetical protein
MSGHNTVQRVTSSKRQRLQKLQQPDLSRSQRQLQNTPISSTPPFPAILSKSVPTLPSLKNRAYNAEEILANISDKYSTDDSNLFHSLINYCYELQSQVSELKRNKELAIKQAVEVIKQKALREAQLNNEVGNDSQGNVDVRDASLATVVEKIESKLSQIRQIFSNTDPLHVRYKAASKIQACAKCCLVRKRYLRFHLTMENLRRVKCQSVIALCLGMITKLEKQRNGVTLFVIKRNTKTTSCVFHVWKIITNVSAPRRREALKVVELKAKDKATELMMEVMDNDVILVMHHILTHL